MMLRSGGGNETCPASACEDPAHGPATANGSHRETRKPPASPFTKGFVSNPSSDETQSVMVPSVNFC
jgi:hypothetical protein